MIEAVASTVIVAVMLVAALNAVGAARLGETRLSDKARGQYLAGSMMTEILQQAYQEPGAPSGSLGPEAGETTAGNRNLFDDVDDYHGWSETPPCEKDGTLITGFTGWQRSVSVRLAEPNDPASTSPGSDQGVKVITVTISRNGSEVTTLVALRTSTWPAVGTLYRYTAGGGGQPGNNQPIAVAIGEPLTGPATLPVAFDGGGSRDPDNQDTLTFTWNFGDGTTASGATPVHTYPAGVYNVTLTVSDGRGGIDADMLTIFAW